MQVWLCNISIRQVHNAALHEKIANSDRTKFVTYKTIIPQLDEHPVYSRSPITLIPEHLRLAFTRMRLSSHRLRVETGRWARLPREQRLCRCGEIQDEKHVLQDCILVAHIRDEYEHTVSYPEILRDASHPCDFKLIIDILTFYQ